MSRESARENVIEHKDPVGPSEGLHDQRESGVAMSPSCEKQEPDIARRRVPNTSHVSKLLRFGVLVFLWPSSVNRDERGRKTYCRTGLDHITQQDADGELGDQRPRVGGVEALGNHSFFCRIPVR